MPLRKVMEDAVGGEKVEFEGVERAGGGRGAEAAVGLGDALRGPGELADPREGEGLGGEPADGAAEGEAALEGHGAVGGGRREGDLHGTGALGGCYLAAAEADGEGEAEGQ